MRPSKLILASALCVTATFGFAADTPKPNIILILADDIGLGDLHCSVGPIKTPHIGREVLIPTILKQAGYVTASVGKWWQFQQPPSDWGFDEYLTFPGDGVYWRAQSKTYTINGNEQDLPEGEYLPDHMHRFAADFITRHKNRSFFLFYPMSHIHTPIMRTPESKPGAMKEQLYADNIEYMDNLVGSLIAELERQH